MEFIFAVNKLEKNSENPGKVQFEGLVHLLRYIRDNKTFGIKYYSEMNDAPLYDLLRQASIKTDNQLVDLSDSSCKYCPDTLMELMLGFRSCLWPTIIQLPPPQSAHSARTAAILEMR